MTILPHVNRDGKISISFTRIIPPAAPISAPLSYVHTGTCNAKVLHHSHCLVVKLMHGWALHKVLRPSYEITSSDTRVPMSQ